MRRVVVIGIDGMDWQVTSSLLEELPVISGLSKTGYASEMKAVFPPDSIPSWISIFTGEDPSRHGILESIDYFKKDAKQFSVDTGAFRGRTFWDGASEIGRKVIVVNPLMAYPPWEVNGIMASGPVFISGRSGTYPPCLAEEEKLPPLGGIVDFPEKKELGAFYEKTKEETSSIVDFTCRLMRSNRWDLTFLTLLTMDRVCHFFWRYYDRDDPTYPGPGEYERVVPDFYRFMDGCVGRLAEASGEDALIMIVSDHGHAMRPPLLFNVNQLLMENGLLESRIRGPRLLSPRYHMEKTKNIVLETLHRLDMEDLSYRFAHVFPWTRKMKKKDFMTSPAGNIATASGFGGTNPFGGIEVSPERCAEKGLEYEDVRDRVIGLLMDFRDGSGENVFIWARRREEMFEGPHIGRYPDILYEMRPEYGTSWSVHLPVITINPRHRKISGGHRNQSTLVIGPLDPDRKVIPERVSPLNISPTVLDLLGAEGLGERTFLA